MTHGDLLMIALQTLSFHPFHSSSTNVPSSSTCGGLPHFMIQNLETGYKSVCSDLDGQLSGEALCEADTSEGTQWRHQNLLSTGMPGNV